MFLNDVRIRTLGIAVPAILGVLLVGGLGATALLLASMGDIRDAAAQIQSAPDKLPQLVTGIDGLGLVLRGASGLYAMLLLSLAGFFLWFTRIRLEKPLTAIEAALQEAERKGLIERDFARVRPTQRGFDFLSDLQEIFLSNTV